MKTQTPSVSESKPRLFGRLGSLVMVESKAGEATAAGYSVKWNESAQTCEAKTAEGETVFSALCKGGDSWLVMYSPRFYTLEDTPQRLAKPAQWVAGHLVRVIVKKGEESRHGNRHALIDGVQRVPVDILRIAAGRDAWMRQIQGRCLECKAYVAVGETECELCPICYEKAEEENANQ